jgi:hypothetical protein
MSDRNTRNLFGVHQKKENKFQKEIFVLWIKKNFEPSFLDVRSYTSKLYANLKGIPDILLLFNGKSYYFELKVGKNGLSPVQKLRKKEIEQAGGIYFEVKEEWFYNGGDNIIKQTILN